MPPEMNTSFDADFYKQTLSCLPDIKRFELENTDANTLSYNVPFTLDEITSAIRSFQSGKAAGPDGFGPEFYKTFCDILAHTCQTLAG